MSEPRVDYDSDSRNEDRFGLEPIWNVLQRLIEQKKIPTPPPDARPPGEREPVTVRRDRPDDV